MYKPKRGLWTSEDVGIQHPDRAMDFVADYILDKYVMKDKYSRVAIDGTNKNEWVVLTGEITSSAKVDIEETVREAYKILGYKFVPRVINLIFEQSPDIAQGISLADDEIGAGDQGIMIGYANTESKDYLPLALYLSKKIICALQTLRMYKKPNKCGCDMKAQVTIDYDKEIPEVHTVVVALQHDEDEDLDTLRKEIKRIILDMFEKEDVKVSDNLIWHINGTGKFIIGGPFSDSGEVGRKLICDSYGGYAAIGGGNTHGKDATKVDASAAYATRWLAKNIVASGITDECEVQLGYVIGVAEPVSINVDLKGQQKVNITEEVIEKYIKDNISLSVKGIIDRFNLRRHLRHKWSALGYTGTVWQTDEYLAPWEELTIANDLRSLVKEDSSVF